MNPFAEGLRDGSLQCPDTSSPLLSTLVIDWDPGASLNLAILSVQ